MPHFEFTRRIAGFAYLWVLALVAILSISLTLAMEVDATAVRRDQERQLLSIGNEFRNAIARYNEEVSPSGGHEYPERLEDLTLDPRGFVRKRFLRKIYIDPMTGKARWGEVRFGGRIVGVYSLSDRKPIKQDGFDDVDRNFKSMPTYRDWVFSDPAVSGQLGTNPETARTP